MTDVEQIKQATREETLESKLQQALQANQQLHMKAVAMEEILKRLHAVAKHGSVRSGALQYLRDELMRVFGEEPATAPASDDD